MRACVCSLARSPEGPAGLRVARFLETPHFSPLSFFPSSTSLPFPSVLSACPPPSCPPFLLHFSYCFSQPPSLQANLPTDLKFTQHSCRRCTFLHLVLRPPTTRLPLLSSVIQPLLTCPAAVLLFQHDSELSSRVTCPLVPSSPSCLTTCSFYISRLPFPSFVLSFFFMAPCI